jgi:hypothetical protein
MTNQNCRTAEDREYTAKHLPYHLIKAGMIQELRELMQDKDFLADAAEFLINWTDDPTVKVVLDKDNHC